MELHLLDVDLSCEQEWSALDTQVQEKLLQDDVSDIHESRDSREPQPSLFLPSHYHDALKEATFFAVGGDLRTAPVLPEPRAVATAGGKAPSVTADSGSDQARRDALEVLCSILGKAGKEGKGNMQVTVSTKDSGKSPRGDDGELPETYENALSMGQFIATSDIPGRSDVPQVSSSSEEERFKTSSGEEDEEQEEQEEKKEDGAPKPSGIRKMSARSTSTDSTFPEPAAKRSRRHSDAGTDAGGSSSDSRKATTGAADAATVAGKAAQRFTRAWLDNVYSSVRPADGKLEDSQSGEIPLSDMSMPPHARDHSIGEC